MMTEEARKTKEQAITTDLQFFDATVKEFKADKKRHGFTGYAATWDLDQVNDVIVRGAFADTIKERGPREVDGKTYSDIKILWQHNWDWPIGLPALLREDDAGLFVDAVLANTTMGNEIFELMSGDLPVIDKISIGYRVMKHTYDSETGIFYLTALKLMEFSPVTFPANMAATILNSKGATSMFAAQMFGFDVKTIEAVKLLQEILESGANVNDLKKALALVALPPQAKEPESKGSDTQKAVTEWLGEWAADMKKLNERR